MDELKTNALIQAIKRKDVPAVQELIQSGADLNRTDYQGWTPLFHAAGRGHREIMELLIQAGADVNHGRKNGFTPLFSAALAGQVEAVKLLLKAGAQPAALKGLPLDHYIAAENKKREQILQLLTTNGVAS